MMKMRLFVPILLLFVSSSLLAQTEIVSITYAGDSAVIFSNTPPDTLTYYWQGTSCGTLMNHSGSSTVATTSGTYYLRAYYSTGDVWETSCASTIVLFPDYVKPVLSNVTTGPVDTGADILATSNEDGMIYLVPDGTADTITDITVAQVAQVASVADVASTLSTSGIQAGDYIVYAVDGSDNVSAASPVIIVNWAVGIDLDADLGPVQIYPSTVTDILHIKSESQVSSAIVYTLQGSRMIHITAPTDQIDMSALGAGVYIVNIKLEDNTVFNGKVTKR